MLPRKRTRADQQAELIAQQSPYVLYGTPLPPEDSSARDKNAYVPEWQQEVRDEQGRKRLHGAFTGGFSAGYFNTVGSKEGWTPSTFVSSKKDRAKDGAKGLREQTVEDFMDEEDLKDQEEEQRVQHDQAFAALGERDGSNQVQEATDAFLNLWRPEGEETMGVKLLKRMGWKPGQGIGPMVRRAADYGVGAAAKEQLAAEDDEIETHLFAPQDVRSATVAEEHDQKGLGYRKDSEQGTLRDELGIGERQAQEDREDLGNYAPSLAQSNVSSRAKERKPIVRSGFGVGVLNDTGSGDDDDDPYDVGPKLSFSRSIAVKREKKPKSSPKASENPGSRPRNKLDTRPASSLSSAFRRCHDGRLPPDGFTLSAQQLVGISDLQKSFPLPVVPGDWEPTPSGIIIPGSISTEDARRTSSTNAANTLDPHARAALLGEASLPGKSVFDFLTPSARDKLAASSGRADLPAGRGELGPALASSSGPAASQLPVLDSVTAKAALSKVMMGRSPYAGDQESLEKSSRYKDFLKVKAGLLKDASVNKPMNVGFADWQKELAEFVRMAEVFKPMSGAMASRFTTSGKSEDKVEGRLPGSAAVQEGSSKKDVTRKPKGDPAEEAARMGMYGPLTRVIKAWDPDRLLCRRFGIKPPTPAEADLEIRRATLAGAASNPSRSEGQGWNQITEDTTLPLEARQPQASIDVERNEALEAQRPDQSVFDSIFK